MTARFSWNQRNTRGHRPRLQFGNCNFPKLSPTFSYTLNLVAYQQPLDFIDKADCSTYDQGDQTAQSGRSRRFEMRTIFSVSILMVVVMASLTSAGAQAPANTAATQPQITFTKDVAPILQNKCQVCHRPDTFAPMSLLTFEDVRPWAKAIKEKVVTRMMPPWYIDRNVGVRHFKDDPSLSDAEIATIVKWVDYGAVRGNPADMPVPRQ